MNIYCEKFNFLAKFRKTPNNGCWNYDQIKETLAVIILKEWIVNIYTNTRYYELEKLKQASTL